MNLEVISLRLNSEKIKMIEQIAEMTEQDVKCECMLHRFVDNQGNHHYSVIQGDTKYLNEISNFIDFSRGEDILLRTPIKDFIDLALIEQHAERLEIQKNSEFWRFLG